MHLTFKFDCNRIDIHSESRLAKVSLYAFCLYCG